jgi:uncharacterized protein (TIGR03083 family)
MTAVRAPDARAVAAAAESLERQLRPAVDQDWSVQAGDLIWTVRDVVDHLADVCGFYSLHLGAQSPDRLRVDVRPHPAASNAERLAVAAAATRLLTATIRAAPPRATGWHFGGPADATGFASLACNELLVHGWDIARGLGLPWETDDELCGRVLSRTFPAVPVSDIAWPALASANGRCP